MKEKNKFTTHLLFGIILVTLSIIFYFVHYLLFHDSHHIFIYLIGDIAFVPIEVLLVTLILHKLLEEREKRSMLHKLNMVIGVFFSEVGTEMLGYFKDFQQNKDANAPILVNNEWKKEDFDKISQALKSIDYKITTTDNDLKKLQDFVVSKRVFMLGLLQNPNLLEHDTFTATLWAIFHLTDELGHRKDIANLPEKDKDHLANDIKRAYRLLIRQWIEYLKHLKEDYPYLFSLAVRTNPFNPEANVEF
ncbi:MAG: hypothetical protein ACIAQZ_02880 [Sedimentisphaeraceae bacterium JB056]